MFCHKTNGKLLCETVQSHSTSESKAVKNYIFVRSCFYKNNHLCGNKWVVNYTFCHAAMKSQE